MPVVKSNADAGAFLTAVGGQKGEKMNEVKKEIAELEQLLATTSQASQSTQLLKKRKEMKEVDNALELMKTDYKRRMDECEERRIAFESKQGKMRDQVLKFEKFIQENDAKRLRAETKAKGERKLYNEKVDEIKQLTNKLEMLEKEQFALLSELNNRRCFRDFLEKVVEVSDMAYEEVNDVLNRHDVLIVANKDLVNFEDEQDKEVDETRKNLLALQTEAQNIELTRNSYMQDKQKDLEQVRLRGKQVEASKEIEGNKVKNLQQEYGAVKGAINNIYIRTCSTMRSKPLFPPASNATIEEVLDFDLSVMNTRIRDLLDIREDFNKNGFNVNDSVFMDRGLEEGSMSSVTTSGLPAGGSKSMVSAGGSRTSR